MDHAEIRRAAARGIERMLAANSLPVSLFDDQREMLESTVRWLYRFDASRRAYVAQATGLGKTIEQGAIVTACEGLRILIVVPTKIMVAQFMRDMIAFTEGTIAHASSLRDVRNAEGEVIGTHWRGQRHDVLVATDETFKAQFMLIKAELDPHIILWDECHWSYTEKAQTALSAFPDAIVIGFSATPDYLTTTAKAGYTPVTLDNGQVLYGPAERFARTYYPELLDERTARWGIQHGRLASLAWGQLDFALNLDDVRVIDGPGGMDFDQSELQSIMQQNWPFIVQVVRKLYQSGQYQLASRYAAAVCPGVNEAHELAEELCSIGLAAAAITQKTKDKERDAIIARGARGELQHLSSVFVLREGWNAPNAEVAMMLRPTKSRVLYVQFMGRVLRLYGDKVALVLDPHYQNMRFAPLYAPVLFGTPGQVVHAGDILVGKNDRRSISPYLLDRLEPVLTVRPLEIEHWAGEDGTFEAEGTTWSTLKAAEAILGVSRDSIESRAATCQQRQGRDAGGHRRTFYDLPALGEACADLLQEINNAQEDNTFEADGEIWVTIGCAAGMFRIAAPSITRRVTTCRQRQGKDVGGRLRTYYALSELKKACANLLEADQAGEDGTFEADGERWATIAAAAAVLTVSKDIVKARLSSCRQRPGKDRQNHVLTFYSLSDLKKACADQMQELPVAGEDGTFTVGNEVWCTKAAAVPLLSVSITAVKKRLSVCRDRQGKDRGGRVQTFYALSDLREACKDVRVWTKKE